VRVNETLSPKVGDPRSRLGKVGRFIYFVRFLLYIAQKADLEESWTRHAKRMSVDIDLRNNIPRYASRQEAIQVTVADINT